MKQAICFVLALTLSIAAQAQSTPEIPAGWWGIPKTDARLTVGGYVKFDLIHDFNPIGNVSYFDVSKIPTTGAKGVNTHLQANETRLFIDVRHPSKLGELRAYTEGDFYGSSGTFRLRHAYVEIGGKLLAGQTWSVFMDENIIPATLDFEKPVAYAFERHPIIRWKQPINNDAYVAIGLEEPSINIEAPSIPGTFESPIPDITARARITKKWGHAQLSAFFAMTNFRPSAGEVSSSSFFGGNLSGQFNFLEKDKITYQIVTGPGVARYRGSKYAVADTSGDIKALYGTGLTVGIFHYWSTAFSSNLVVNFGLEDPVPEQAGSDIENVGYGAVNLVWHLTDFAFAGVEYLYGFRNDIDGSSGSANRIQFSVQVNFNQ